MALCPAPPLKLRQEKGRAVAVVGSVLNRSVVEKAGVRVPHVADEH